MKNIITILLLLISSVAFGQGTINFGASRSTDTGITKGQLKFTAYANSNTSRYLTVNSNGYVVFGVPAGGGSAGDSTVFFTVYRADTMRIGIYGKIRSDSVLMRGLITSLTNYTDSLYTVLSTKQGADSLLLAGQISTLQSDVVTLDSALGVAFGAISELYDTLPNYVPYTGATTDVNLGTHNILPNSVRLSTSPTGTLTNVGQLYWDVANVTPSVPLNANVTLQMGQEMYIRAVNKTGVQINDGQVVYVNDAQGNNPTIALANSDSVNTSIVVGVATENIAINGTGFVTTFGIVNGFNTSTFNDGDALYLNTVSGQLSNTIPLPPHNVVKVAIALNSTTNGKIFVQPSEPLGQDTTFVAPYNSNRVAPTQRSISTYASKIVRDSASALRTVINTKGSGTVTSVATGFGLSGGTITTTGTIIADSVSLATKALVKKQIDSVAALTGGSGGSPLSATSPSVLYKSGSDTLKGASKVVIDSTDGRLVFPQDTTTSAVNAFYGGGVKIGGSNRMGMGAVRISDTVSIPAALQRAINAQTASLMFPLVSGNIQYTNNYAYTGMLQVLGTFSYVPAAYNSTIQHLNYNKTLITTAAGANSAAQIRTGSLAQSAGIICGNTKFSGGGGRGTFTFSFPTYLSTERIMIGYVGGTAVGNFTADPSALIGLSSSLLLVKDAADATLFFMHTNTSGVAPTKVNTGITPNADDLYRLTIYIAPNSTYYMQLEVISRSAPIQVITINPTTAIPPVGSRMVSYQGVNNGSAGGVVSYGIIQVMEEIY